jgi:hypothetical protein
MKHIININGFYVGFGGSKTELQEGQSEAPFAPPIDLIKPKWNGSEWIEGATPEDLLEYQRLLIPQVITRRQFKIALAVLGKNETDILNGINQLPEPTQTIARISYTEAGTFERFNPELIFVATNFLQMTESDIDEIFIIGNQY